MPYDNYRCCISLGTLRATEERSFVDKHSLRSSTAFSYLIMASYIEGTAAD